jgi:acetate kinase
VLVLNSGSSSVKFALLDPGSGQRVLGGQVEKVGTAEAVLHIRRDPGDPVTERLADGSCPVVSLGRLDALVFTGGVGENSAVIRGLVLARLGFLGLAEDAGANAQHGLATRGRISPDGPVLALVVPTDEELMIARDTARLVAADRP